MIAHIFSMTSILESEKYMDTATEAFFKVLEEYADNGEPFNIGKWMHMYTFDVIGELFFGRMFGFIDERKDIGGYMGAVDIILPHAIRMGVLWEWMRPFQILLVPFSSSLRHGITVFNNLAAESRRLVDERVGTKSERTDMLAKLLKVAADKSPDFDVTDVYTEAYTAMYAASSFGQAPC